MKIRLGFVANSSSSSFCLFGAVMDKRDGIGKIAGAHGLECRKMPDDDDHYIGLEWCDVRDDETGAQFKARVKAALEAAFPGETFVLGTHSEAWYDG